MPTEPRTPDQLADSIREANERILELHLRGFSLLRHLGEPDLADFCARARGGPGVQEYAPGKVICSEGDANPGHLFLIRQGWVQVRVKTPEGGERP